MPFTPFGWLDRPSELDPNVGETPAEWLARIAAYDAANPGARTPLDAAGLIGIETRTTDYADDVVATEAVARDAADVVLGDAIDAETARAVAAESDLQDQIDGLGGGGGGGVTALSWTGLSFGSGWADGTVGGQTQTAAWAKDDYGIVHLRGLIQGGSLVANTLLFTLPSGARPPIISGGAGYAKVGADMIDSVGNPARALLDVWASNGQVRLSTAYIGSPDGFGFSNNIMLDGVSFSTV